MEKPWIKLWTRWYETMSHAKLKPEALHTGPHLLVIAGKYGRREDGSAALVGPDGEPLRITDLARMTRWSTKKMADIIADLRRVKTLEVDGDAYVFPKFQRWQSKPAPESERSRNAPRGRAYVYFAQAGGPAGLIKIGFSKNPWSRTKDMQTSNGERIELLATVRGTIEDERALHARFGDDRVQGEWFAPSQSILDYVVALRSSSVVATVAPTKEDRGQRTEPTPPNPPPAGGESAQGEIPGAEHAPKRGRGRGESKARSRAREADPVLVECANAVIDRLNERRAWIAERFQLDRVQQFRHAPGNRREIMRVLVEEQEPLDTLLAVVDAAAREVARARGEGLEWLTPVTPFRQANWPRYVGKVGAPSSGEARTLTAEQARAYADQHHRAPDGWRFDRERNLVPDEVQP